MYTFDYYFSIFSKLQCDAEQQRDDANLELKSNGKSDLTKNLNFGVPGGLPCCDVAETCHSTDVIIIWQEKVSTAFQVTSLSPFF